MAEYVEVVILARGKDSGDLQAIHAAHARVVVSPPVPGPVDMKRPPTTVTIEAHPDPKERTGLELTVRGAGGAPTAALQYVRSLFRTLANYAKTGRV